MGWFNHHSSDLKKAIREYILQKNMDNLLKTKKHQVCIGVSFFFLNKTLSAKILHVLLKSTWGITPLGTWLVKGGYEPFIARLRRSLGDENDHHGYDHHFLVMGS